MENIINLELFPGVRLTYCLERKFKTSVLSAQIITPLRDDTAAFCALFPAVLRRGTARYPNMGAISNRLDMLYGAAVDYTVRKRGENQMLGFAASMIDDRFVPEGEGLLKPTAELIGELLCDPVMEDSCFRRDYFSSEKDNLLDEIRAVINDKGSYADYRLLREMCAGEPYGVPRLGEESGAAAIQPDELYRRYRELLSSGRIELFYGGSAELERVEEILRGALAALPRPDRRNDLILAEPHRGREDREVRYVNESMDVTQGKLGMGFSCGSDDDIALIFGNAMFGGTSNSRLFLNVREKLSLCYYASSSYHRLKNMITVASGIEFENYQKTCDEILAQLAVIQNQAWEDWEFEGARSILLNQYTSVGDSLGALENFYLAQIVEGRSESPEEMIEKIRRVTPERVAAAMRTVTLDTVYFLKGKESGGTENVDGETIHGKEGGVS